LPDLRVLVGPRSTRTRADGRFAVDHVPVGDQVVRLSDGVATSVSLAVASVLEYTST
jgi:hypothetical protein